MSKESGIELCQSLYPSAFRKTKGIVTWVNLVWGILFLEASVAVLKEKISSLETLGFRNDLIYSAGLLQGEWFLYFCLSRNEDQFKVLKS